MTTKNNNKAGFKKATLPDWHINFVRIINNNAEIRRFTSIGIINYLKQKNVIDANKKAYVKFFNDRFAVYSDNIIIKYNYTEEFLINCLVASFKSFAASAQETIDVFIEENLKLNGVSDSNPVEE